ncbi:hypothetical protein [Amphritea balenae]|uniref:hypothetical protein n=1 Tax=Amphritea balenae TaxID=452629 RepID=UPI0014767E8B|nr:hypothetical protein [Amphritea balenae]GGK78065.1 hypothetical protein GCM10007941_30210 [Amphritea balenae]
MSAIHIADIDVSYDNPQVLGPLSLKPLSLELMAGEVVVIIDKSNCGKSTLLKRVGLRD